MLLFYEYSKTALIKTQIIPIKMKKKKYIEKQQQMDDKLYEKKIT